MTKFEQIGVLFQNEATNTYEAKKSFAFSCRCCCERGMRIDCDRCAIAVAYQLTVAAFEPKNVSNSPSAARVSVVAKQ